MPSDLDTRFVTLQTLILSSALLLTTLFAITLGIGYWLYQNTEAQFTLQDQSGWIRFPESLQVGAEVHNALQVEVDQSIQTKVPIKQAIDIPIPGDINAVVSVDTSIPININVPVKDLLVIDQKIAIDTQVQVTVAGIDIDLPIKGNIPIKAEIPLDLNIPINNNIPLVFSSPVTLSLNEALHAELDTFLDTSIPIKGILNLPVTSDIEATLNFPQQPVEAGLHYLDLTLPLQTIEISSIENSQ